MTKFLILLIAVFFLFSCQEDPEIPVVPPPTEPITHNYWTQINGPFGADVWTLRVDDSAPATVAMGGVNRFFFSEDSGENWAMKLISDGSTSPWGSIEVHSIACLGNNRYLAAGLIEGWKIYKTSNSGDTWTSHDIPINNGRYDYGVYDLEKDDRGNIWAATLPDGVLVSADNGESWSRKNEGLTSLCTKVLEFDFGKRIMYVGTLNGLFYSENYGESWNYIPSCDKNTIDAIDIHYSTEGYSDFYAVTGFDECFYTSRDGLSFQKTADVGHHNAGNGIEYWYYRGTDLIIDKNNKNRILLTYDPDGIIMSEDGGFKWELINQGYDY